MPRFQLHIGGYLPHNLDWHSYGAITSPFWCLWYVMGEEHWVDSNGAHIEAGPDRIILAPAHVVYETFNRVPAAHLYLHFSVAPQYGFDAPSLITVMLNDLIRHQIDELLAAFRSDREDRAQVLCYHSAALLNMCFAYHPLQVRVLPEELRALLQRIDARPGDDLSNANMAQQVNLSVNRFIFWFQKYMEQAPASYVREVRIEKASELLAFSNLTIDEIAARLGFPNRHYFSRAFARHAQSGPAAFRKKHQNLYLESRNDEYIQTQ